jgi:hypothetical protein
VGGHGGDSTTWRVQSGRGGHVLSLTEEGRAELRRDQARAKGSVFVVFVRSLYTVGRGSNRRVEGK